MRTRKQRRRWQDVVNPAFTRWWSANRTHRAIGGIADERMQKEAWRELCAASRLINAEFAKSEHREFAALDQEITKPLDGEVWPWPVKGEPGKAYITNPESCSIFRYLVFLKYGITFRELVCDVERDPKGYQKLTRVHSDYRRVKWSGGLDSLRLKFNLDHFAIIVQGLDLGLKELNEQELAECLDEICPCCKKHSADYLKKLRTHIVRACRSDRAKRSTGRRTRRGKAVREFST